MSKGQENKAVIRTPDQRLRVFVSSALGELADERRAVSRAISARRLTPVMFTLLDALRDRLGLTGTKKGCDQGACGAWPEPESVKGVVS